MRYRAALRSADIFTTEMTTLLTPANVLVVRKDREYGVEVQMTDWALLRIKGQCLNKKRYRKNDVVFPPIHYYNLDWTETTFDMIGKSTR